MSGSVTIVGLGPGDFDAISEPIRELLLDAEALVVIRTMHHPAAAELAARRSVESADDLYDKAATFDEVYDALAARIVDAAASGEAVVFAVPGSPNVGEFTVPRVKALCQGRGIECRVIPGISFIEAAIFATGIDPLAKGLQIIDARDLPSPLIIDKPTIVAQVDLPEVLADACAAISRVVPEGTQVTILSGLGASDESISQVPIDEVDPSSAGLRVSLFVDPEPGGLVGAVRTMRRLRRECPWDKTQDHRTLVNNLVEESYELIEAISALPLEAPGGEPDYGAYADVEEELGDVLMQVLFHATLAEEAGAFDIDDVAEVLRRKLVHRHPHIYGDVVADTPEEVRRNWEQIKAAEKGRVSLMDDVPEGMPAMTRALKLIGRAASAGFVWPSDLEALAKVSEEVGELAEAMGDKERTEAELGDVLMASIALGRAVGVDPEVALRRAADRFADRFRMVEAEGSVSEATASELVDRWQRAKDATTPPA